MEDRSDWVLITGAAGGIGKALVDEFVNSGYKVIAVDIKWEKSIKRNDRVYDLKIDLGKLYCEPSLEQELAVKVNDITNGKSLVALVNNAAIQVLNPTEKITRQQWEATWDINLHAPFLLIQIFLPGLSKNSGSVVNISSVHATVTKREFVAYATSKAALSSLTRNLAVDIGNKIRVNAIEPAAVETEMLLAGFEGKKKEFATLESYHPMGRIASPREVAELALYLCSDKCKFMNGSCITVTGGIHGNLSDPG